MEKTIRIAITGPESTGKSAMARHLAEYFKVPCVPEFARFYLERYGPEYTQNDIIKIARAQMAYENSYSRLMPQLLICDTDLLVCHIWAEFVFSSCPEEILKLEETNSYHFTLLMNTDLRWEPDPLREHPNHRNELFEIYRKKLDEQNRAYTIISGLGSERFENAKNALTNFCRNKSIVIC